MPTLSDVALQAGVSAATVSRAFNRPERINTETRKRILDAAEKMQYVPLHSSPRPRNLWDGAQPTSAVGFHYFRSTPTDSLQSNPFYSRVLIGALEEASRLGIHLVLSSSDCNSTNPDTALSALVERAPDAMILVHAAEEGLIHAFAARVPRCILVDNKDTRGVCDSVVTDNIGGAVAAIRHLLALGHRRIAYVTTRPADPSFEERLIGYLHACYEYGINIDPQHIVCGDNRDFPFEPLRACLLRPNRPTAVFAASDDHVLSVYHLCNALGLRIPEDISIIGFDDMLYCTQMIPPLSTIHVNAELMGCAAVRRLFEETAPFVDGGQPIHGVRLVLPTHLVERGSCLAVQSA